MVFTPDMVMCKDHARFYTRKEIRSVPLLARPSCSREEEDITISV